MTAKTRNILWGILAVVLVAVAVAWMVINPGPEHIEDTNGAEDFSLQTITEEDIVANQMGTRGGLTQSELSYKFAGLNLSDGIEYSCKKFTGVYQLYTCHIFKGSDISVSLAEFEIKSGNFAFYIVLDGKIVGEVKPEEDGFSEFTMENIEQSGTLEYYIAGESANFRFISPTEW